LRLARDATNQPSMLMPTHGYEPKRPCHLGANLLAASQPSQRIEEPESASDQTEQRRHPVALRGSITKMATARGGSRNASGSGNGLVQCLSK
jgi:hypothetical protein